jgi:hypothetical protein
METARKIFTDLRSYGENFAFRERHFDRSNAVKIMLYTNFMFVNKTGTDLIVSEQVIGKCSNDYLMAIIPYIDEQTKKKSWSIYLEVEGFQKSEAIDLKNVGTSGAITLDSIGESDFRQLQFGVSIALGPIPFNKTTIITVTPRYIVLNKLHCPLMIRQPFADYSKK